MNAAASDRLTGEERREAILAAALPLFASKGFDAVTTREVAEASGVSEALLYRHFAGKRALYDAIQHSCVIRATADAQRLESLPDSTSTLVLATYVLLRNIQLGSLPGEAQPGETEMPRLILRSLLTDGAFARAFMQAAAAPWQAKMERCAAVAIAAGDIENDLETTHLGVWFTHHVAAALAFFRLPGQSVIDYPGGADPERLLDQSVRFGLRGLGLTRAAIATHYNPQAFAVLFGTAASHT